MMKRMHRNGLRNRCRILPLLIVIVLMVGWLPADESQAAVLLVNSLDDTTTAGDGYCTLREAIANANADSDTTAGDCAAGSGADSINFVPSLAGSTITLAAGQLTVSSAVTINGLGAQVLAVSGNDSGRVFYITGGPVVINHLTIRDGNATQYGGGIFNLGDLTLNDCVVRDNRTTTWAASGGYGGGGIYQAGRLVVNRTAIIYNRSYHHGGGILEDGAIETTINDSSISNNRADNGSNKGGGGAIFRWMGNGVLTINNTTISGNWVRKNGGGICFGYADGNGSAGTLNLNHVTITGNRSGKLSGGIGNYYQAVFNIQNSIIANNTAYSGDGNCELIGPHNSLGYNLESGTTCGFTGAGDQQNTNPLLGSLADNGGPTETHSLQSGSPAINRIPIGTNGCVAAGKDQRSALRAYGTAPDNKCDVGAYEVGNSFEVDISGVGLYRLHKTLVEVSSPGSLTRLLAVYTNADHPYSTGSPGGNGVGWGQYWSFTPTGGGYILKLTLPHAYGINHPNTKACKYTGLAGMGWDCARSASTDTSVTRDNITALSDWAVGYNVGPTAITLLGYSDRPQESSSLILLSTLILMAILALISLRWQENHKLAL